MEVKGSGKGTILEVNEERGLGKTIDVILYDGTLRVGEEIVLGGKSGVIRTKVRALLEPKSLNDMRHPHEKFSNIKEIHAAAGVKVAAPNLDDALPGSPVLRADHESAEQEIKEEIQSVKIESSQLGVTVKADSLGALEAIIQLLKDRKIPIQKADVGEVSRKDIIEGSAVAEKEKYLGVVFAFGTKLVPSATEEADKRSVKVFSSHVIYELIENYEHWKEEEQNKERMEAVSKLTLPAKITILKGSVFRNSGPAIFGVRVETGRIKSEAMLMKKGITVGRVNAVQSEGKNLEEGKQGEEVAISASDIVIGKNVRENDTLYTYIPESQWEMFEKYSDMFSDEEQELIEEIKKMQLKNKKDEGE